MNTKVKGLNDQKHEIRLKSGVLTWVKIRKVAKRWCDDFAKKKKLKRIATALHPSGNHPIAKGSSDGAATNPWNPCAKKVKFFGLVQRTSGRKDPNTERWTVGLCKTNH